MSTEAQKLIVREFNVCGRCGTVLQVRTLDDNLVVPVVARKNVRSGCCNYYVATTIEIVEDSKVFDSSTYPTYRTGKTLQDQLERARAECGNARTMMESAHVTVRTLRQKIASLEARLSPPPPKQKKLKKKSTKPSSGIASDENPSAK